MTPATSIQPTGIPCFDVFLLCCMVMDCCAKCCTDEERSNVEDYREGMMDPLLIGPSTRSTAVNYTTPTRRQEQIAKAAPTEKMTNILKAALTWSHDDINQMPKQQTMDSEKQTNTPI